MNLEYTWALQNCKIVEEITQNPISHSSNDPIHQRMILKALSFSFLKNVFFNLISCF